jgi:putative nucleotidyltransferase with HDIG domain
MSKLDLQIPDKDLPMLAAVAVKAMELLNNPNVSNTQLNDLIRQDPALATRILHIANSPFYCGRFQARKISDAILRMGLRQLRNILIVAATGELFDTDDKHVRSIWNHAQIVAHATDKLTRMLSLPDAEEAFIAGLLHDIGKFIIYRQHPEPYGGLIREAVDRNLRLVQVEDERLQYFNHVSVGAMAIRKWKLPDAMIEVARFHHVVESDIPKDLENKNLVCAVSLVNVLVNNVTADTPVCTREAVPTLACAQHLKLNPERIDKFTTILLALSKEHEESSQDAETPKALESA